MNNQFSENLKKIRKEQNLSQEELADKLGVSRQAISKWESGQAYPEMDKIITICNMFNVNIDDLLHNDIKEVKGEEESKKKINSFVDGFLKYITNTVNMFSSMTFKSKVKCIFEQLVIAGLLAFASFIVVTILSGLVTDIFSFIPAEAISILHRIITSILTVFCFILSLVVITHVFKTRYLDYYESMDKPEEKTEGETSEEGETTEEGKTVKLDKKDRKIVIRDPKHSEYRFIKGLLKVIVGIIKFFALCFGFYLALILIALFCSFVLSFLIIKTGLFFVGLVVCVLAASVIVGDILLLILNFVFNRKSNKKLMIWSFLLGLVLCGIGVGLGFAGGLKFDVELDNSTLASTVTTEHDMDYNLILAGFDYGNVDFVESNINNIKVEYTVNKYCTVNESKHENILHATAVCHNPTKVAREVIKNLNNKKVIGFDQYIEKVTIYANKQNIDILRNNTDNYFAEQREYEKQIENYENEINRLEEENNDLRNKIYELQELENED